LQGSFPEFSRGTHQEIKFILALSTVSLDNNADLLVLRLSSNGAFCTRLGSIRHALACHLLG